MDRSIHHKRKTIEKIGEKVCFLCGVIKRLVFPYALMSIAWAGRREGVRLAEYLFLVTCRTNYSYAVVERSQLSLNMHKTRQNRTDRVGGGGTAERAGRGWKAEASWKPRFLHKLS